MLTPEQLAARVNTLGSSEIAAIAGLSRFSGPLDVWQHKGAQAATHQEEPRNAEQMALGHLMEPVIAELALVKIGSGQIVRDQITTMHRDHEWATATCDYRWRCAAERRILETKNVGRYMCGDWDDGPPGYVDCQVQWQLECCNVDVGYIAALLGGRDLVVHKIERDREYGASLLRIGERFWTDYVLTGEPPPVDGSKDSSEYLAKRYPKHKQPMKDAGIVGKALMSAYKASHSALAAAKRDESTARNKLCGWLGDAGGCEIDDNKVTWRSSKGRKKVDWEKVAKEYRGALEQSAFVHDDDADSAKWMDSVLAAHTSTGKPSRRFTSKFAK